MSFFNIINDYESFDFGTYFQKITDRDIEKSLSKEKLTTFDFLNLLSDNAENHLEFMAQKAYKITRQYFGKTIQLYVPLYISNYCSNECVYCGFKESNNILREKLSLEEIEKEAKKISKTGMKHILLLTGEAPKITPIDYLKEAVRICKKYFSSISIEIFPMEKEEYSILRNEGVDGLTIYQEVYDKAIYKEVHKKGKKADYAFRLDTAERGAKAGFRQINIGTLFGLGECKKEAFFSGLHAEYLERKYLDTEFSLSLPRINPAEGDFQSNFPLNDKKMVQFMLAFRLFLPNTGINISTRESEEFRNNILPLGVTKFSAGSKTSVGGYEKEDCGTSQFSISDTRQAEEIIRYLKEKGYQPIFKDWEVLV